MFIIVFFIAAIVAVGFLIASIFISNGTVKRYIIISNTVLIVLPIAIIMLFVINLINNSGLNEKYTQYSTSLLSGYRYVGQIDGYEVIETTGLSEYVCYAVDKKDIEIDPMCSLIKSVTVYGNKNTYFDLDPEKVKLSNGKTAYIEDNVVLLKPSLGLITIIGASVFGVLFVINTTVGMIISFVFFIQRNNKKMSN